jgi:hypothetical protein
MDRAPQSETMSPEEAIAFFKSLISDEETFKGELEYSDGELTDSAIEQYFGSVRIILEAMREFSGRGLSIFYGKPSMRIPDLDPEDPDSLGRAIAKLKAAEAAFRKK